MPEITTARPRRRRSTALLAAAALVVTASTSFPASIASAVTGVRPDATMSTWIQPGSAPLDGIGAYVYLAPEPPPDPSQVASEYDYEVMFFYEGGPVGAVGLGSGPNGPDGRKFAGLATGGSATVKVPYEWQRGRLYFLFAHSLGDGLWGGWVFDVWANAWTFIGVGQTPVEWGRLSPISRTIVEWEGTESEGSCSSFPRTDAYFTPTIGVRNGVFSLGTLVNHSTLPWGCPTETTDFLGWAHYRLGS